MYMFPICLCACMCACTTWRPEVHYLISYSLEMRITVVPMNEEETLECLFVTGMRILVMLLLDTLPMLGNVLLLCFFVFFIFGIIGVQLWAGLLRNRCFLDMPDNISIDV